MQVRYTHRLISELVRGIEGSWLFQDSISPPLPETEYQRFLGIQGYVDYPSQPIEPYITEAVVDEPAPSQAVDIPKPKPRTTRKRK
jgi:hypothetical protein